MSAKLLILLCSIATLVVAHESSAIKENEDILLATEARLRRSSNIVAPKIFTIGGGSDDYDDDDDGKSVESYNFQTENWGPEPSLPFRRDFLGAATLNGKLYAIGGTGDYFGQRRETVDVFDPTTQNWTSAPSMNTDRGDRPGVGVLDGRIYVVGGSGGSYRSLSSVEMFHPELNKWTIVGRGMNSYTRNGRGRQGLAAGVLSGNIYAVGGSDGGVQPLNTVEKLNPVTGVWTFVAPMNTPRRMHCVAVLNGKMYAIGGSNRPLHTLNSVEVYDPVSDNWSFVADLSIPRSGAGAVAYNGRIYVIGGVSNSGSLDSTEVYDPLPNTWSILPAKMSIARVFPGVALL